ncbi:MAG: hypothetical protein IJF08_03555 [Clostridia bacterium]|nr:hypothetical protein [Clostridia bacterium]
MNSLKQNRAASFVAVTLVYVIAAVVGVVTYRALSLGLCRTACVVSCRRRTCQYRAVFGGQHPHGGKAAVAQAGI